MKKIFERCVAGVVVVSLTACSTIPAPTGHLAGAQPTRAGGPAVCEPMLLEQSEPSLGWGYRSMLLSERTTKKLGLKGKYKLSQEGCWWTVSIRYIDNDCKEKRSRMVTDLEVDQTGIGLGEEACKAATLAVKAEDIQLRYSDWLNDQATTIEQRGYDYYCRRMRETGNGHVCPNP
jgi:hypothetical protein